MKAITSPNLLQPSTSSFSNFSNPKRLVSNNLAFSTTKKVDYGRYGSSVKCRWMELQGTRDWEGLLDPLDNGLRDEILRYGEFVQAAYRYFNFDTTSPEYGTCLYPDPSMLTECGLCNLGYKVTRNLTATCGVKIPDWANRAPGWVSARSSWIGYTAVCDDPEVISRLGRRDVVIAYRGTATCMEWGENLRAMLTCLPADMASDVDRCSMVQSGFLSLYTSCTEECPSLRDSVRQEVFRILQKYGDEPLSITVTGHSLGAALATLTAYDIATSLGDAAPTITVFSFGGPRVGNGNFRREVDRSGTKVLRIVNDEDPVTRVPGFVVQEGRRGDWVRRVSGRWAYAEIGEELRLSSRGCLNLGVATCHDLKTYLHLVDNFVSSNCPIRMAALKTHNTAFV